MLFKPRPLKITCVNYLLLLPLVIICCVQCCAQAVYDSYVSTNKGHIYKVNLNNCTADSFTSVNFDIYDIALSPSNKLYILDEDNNYFVLNISTMALQRISTGFNLFSLQSDALVCDSVGNLITISNDSIAMNRPALYYVDTLTAAKNLIGTIDYQAAGDLTFFQGDIYYDDVSNYLHRVTLNPVHDYMLGPVDCSDGPYGLSTNIIDTVYCQPAIFVYSDVAICTFNPANGNSTSLCQDILPPGAGYMSGAASLYGLSCQSVHQAFAMPNAFTPNGDGLNDKFFPVLINGVKVTEFRIYDRWGQCVHNAPQPWNGTFNEVTQPEGTYLYYVVFSEDNGMGKQKEVKQQGAVTLLR